MLRECYGLWESIRLRKHYGKWERYGQQEHWGCGSTRAVGVLGLWECYWLWEC